MQWHPTPVLYIYNAYYIYIYIYMTFIMFECKIEMSSRQGINIAEVQGVGK